MFKAWQHGIQFSFTFKLYVDSGQVQFLSKGGPLRLKTGGSVSTIECEDSLHSILYRIEVKFMNHEMTDFVKRVFKKHLTGQFLENYHHRENDDGAVSHNKSLATVHLNSY
jgi:hypothetical protein